MTNEVISPLRRRMIEDMAIRKLSPKTSNRLHPPRQELCGICWPLARYCKRRRSAPISTASKAERGGRRRA